MYNEDYYRNPDREDLERAVATSKWFAPSQVDAREGQLHPSFDDGPTRTVWASPSMLQDFLNLDGKPPQAFANYAKTWGMLDIRDDGEGWELSMNSIFVHPSRRGDSISAPTEPLSVWQFWIAQFRSIISRRSIHKRRPCARLRGMGEGDRPYPNYPIFHLSRTRRDA